MKNCNKIMKKETIEIKGRTINVEYKNLHGNCEYVGLWEKHKDKITINAYLQPEDAEDTKGHECFHMGMCIIRQALGGAGKIETALCSVCTAQDVDPLFRSLLIEYGIDAIPGNRGARGKVLDFIWYRMETIMRHIAAMRLGV